MAWAGIGVVWTVSGGVPKSRLIGQAKADEGGFSFVQISDSHIGFEKPANPDARGTLKEAVDKIAALPRKPAFLIHTGDITHSAKAQQFDDAAQILGGAGSTSITRPASMTSSTRRPQGLSRALRRGRRAAAGIRSIRAAFISSRSSMSSTSRPTAWAISAPTNWLGSTRICAGARPRRRSSCSRIFPSG